MMRAYPTGWNGMPLVCGIVLAAAVAAAAAPLNAEGAAKEALGSLKEAARRTPAVAGRALGPAGGFRLEKTTQTRTPQRVVTQTCVVQGEKATRETAVVEHGVTTTSREEWDVRLTNEDEVSAWLAAAEGGSLTTGRYIPSRRWAPTVTYGARRSDGAGHIYLSYDGPFHWERNSSETARVMLESVIDGACRR